MRIAFIGLGVMGYPMAGHLARARNNVTVYNRSAAKAQAWVNEHQGQSAETPALAAANADVVMVCVGNDDDVRSVVLSEHGALAGMRAGATLIDHTTTSAELAEELAQAAAGKGIHFLDAPVSGGQAGAENGALTIMVGGEAKVFAAHEKLLATYGKKVTHLGPNGCGQKCKMVNQICAAVLIQGLAEGLNFADKAGLDVDAVVDVIGGGAAQSWQLDNRGHTMAADKFDFGFAVDWMHKDLQICLAEAARNNASLPITAQVDDFYRALQDRGMGRLDTSALIRLLRD